MTRLLHPESTGGIFPVFVVISVAEMVLGVYLGSGTKLGEIAGKGTGQVV